VYGFLVKAGGDKFAAKIVKALAQAFYEQGHYERGIEAYELMLKLDPTGPMRRRTVLAVAQGWATLEDWPKLKATYDRLLKNFLLPEAGTEGGAWARSQPIPRSWKAAQARIEKQLRETRRTFTARPSATRRVESNSRAAALYEAYLSRFGKTEGAYEAEFNVAEIDFYTSAEQRRGNALHGDGAP